MVLRKVDENVYQSDFRYASSNYQNFDVIISVAIEHNYPWNTLYVPQLDAVPIDFWNFLRVVSLIHVSTACELPRPEGRGFLLQSPTLPVAFRYG
jgi:hypothetical protein